MSTNPTIGTGIDMDVDSLMARSRPSVLVAAKVATAQKPADCCANEGLCGREPPPAKPRAEFARKPVAKPSSMATGLNNSLGCQIALASSAVVCAAAQLRNKDDQTPGIEPFFGGRNRSDEYTGPIQFLPPNQSHYFF